MNSYLIFKSLHLIAVISWMAGLLYLPRIFVYHSQYNNKPLVSEVFKVMEKKTFFLHNDTRNDFVLDIWIDINT